MALDCLLRLSLLLRPGLFMIDDEGTLSTTDVKAKFINGKPQAIEAKYAMRSQFEWDRFIRFMDRCGGSAAFVCSMWARFASMSCAANSSGTASSGSWTGAAVMTSC
jgi:hypothetical protein